ncbi:unnamed protein product [Cladocopium goreaui]|uniref:Probable myosin light chain kinase DDB_G0282429 n=1 Tax=Cladocopium goreaui TaxID=2562237 RepID=A0A9P1DDG0_9DINO|nr:unnamed protein product [Cladocopium goreaui]
MHLPATHGPESFVCFACAKPLDGYPLKEGVNFRCFFCDKKCHGVGYHVPDQETSTSCWSPEASRETLQKAQSSGSSANGTATSNGVPEAVNGFEMVEDQEDLLRCLGPWLELLQLGHYLEEAKEWCQEMGAAEMDEIRENWEDFAEHLGLSGDERESLAEACQPREMSPLLPAAKSRETFGPDTMPYVMQEKLGQGATASVYRCKRGDEEFAVKVIDLHRFCLHPAYDKLRHHIMREMSLLLMLSHRNIVKLIDFQEAEHTIFLVMELIRGGDLSEYLQRKPNGHMDDEEACHVFLQIVDGLMHIHSKNIVHRDLKPQNILLAEPETTNARNSRRLECPKSKPIEVKLSDFGHSKLVRDGYTYARSHVGTPQYLAPEVANSSRSYDERADLWSLGVVLYVMLTGHYPFRSSEDAAYRQGSFKFRGSGRAEELIAGLIKRRPEDRLSLEQCLRSAWVLGNSSQRATVCLLRPVSTTKECRIRLPLAPKNVSRFKQELDTFSLRHKLSAWLLILEVVVTFNTEVPEVQMEAAWSELWDICHKYCPELKRSNMFPGETGNGGCSPQKGDGANPMLQQEHEALNSIYGLDFEALSDWEWLVNVGHGTSLRVKLPLGYPGSEAPVVQVECPHGTAPNVQRALEDCWSAGSVCVFEMVECLRAAVESALVVGATKEGSEDESPVKVKPVPSPECDVQICHSETLADRKSLFQAHLAKVHNMKEVEWVRDQLLADKRVKGATHNVVAYRFRQRRPNLLIEESDDDGEAGAGKRLLELLINRNDNGVLVMVSRWRGTIHLGADRFRNYQKAAQQLLETQL